MRILSEMQCSKQNEEYRKPVVKKLLASSMGSNENERIMKRIWRNKSRVLFFAGKLNSIKKYDNKIYIKT